jgi:hypothetical protein
MLAGSPLRTIRLWPLDSLGFRLGQSARSKTVHPIDNFDKSGQGTLESFKSLAGRTDCNASAWRSDRTGSDASSRQIAYSSRRQASGLDR